MKEKLKNLMSRANAWIERAGLDKITHFAVAAWLVAECKAYGVGIGCVGFIIVVILAFFKEWIADKQFDERDFWYSALGGFVPLFLAVIQDML